MFSFESDYTEGAHPEILRRLTETNFEQASGYGADRFTASAKERIRAAMHCPAAQICFLAGGTQTNAVAIRTMLEPYEGVVAVQTGHIQTHEAGAIETGGHKVLVLLQHDGKMDAVELDAYLTAFYADETWEHMVCPGMAYITFPTENGRVYSRAELEALREVCDRWKLKLYVDGARLGYGLMSPLADIKLADLAQIADAFTIGGTKVGALCGEALVFPKGNMPSHFLTRIKAMGALLAKGRLIGLQFDTLFTEELYLRISRHAIEKAQEAATLLKGAGLPFAAQPETNQLFVIVTKEQLEVIQRKVRPGFWENLPDGRLVVRFATSWATGEAAIRALKEALEELPQGGIAPDLSAGLR